jgi:hypothetical protein
MKTKKSPSTSAKVKGANVEKRAGKAQKKARIPFDSQEDSPPGGAARSDVPPGGEAPSSSKVKQLHKIPNLEGVRSDSETFLKWKAQEALRSAGITVDPATGRMLKTFQDGSCRWIGGESRSELRTAFTLGENTAQFFRQFRLNEIGFLTLSFPPDVKSPKEAGRRFDSFNSNWLRKLQLPWLRVCEPHKDKRPHYHLLIHLGRDIRTGFQFDTFKECQAEFAWNGYSSRFNELRRAYVSAASPWLVDLWKELRKQCKAAGLGRSELLPIHKQGEAVSQYVGKYISKGSPYRVGEWKGARLVSYSSRSPRRASSRFSWVDSGFPFRLWAAEVASTIGVTHDDISERCGPRWAWRMLQAQEAGLTAKQAGQFLLASHSLTS